MDVRHVAKLANLVVSVGEEKKFSDQFSETLKTVDLINHLDTSGVLPTFQVTGLSNITRPDEIDPDRILPQKSVLEQAGKTHNGFIVVPRTIIDE